MAAVDVRLSVARVLRMHRVTHLMDNCKYIFQRIRVVEKDVRVAVVASETVGTARLAFVLVDIDPSLADAFVHLVYVVFAERLKRLAHYVETFFEGYLPVRNPDEWNVHVVHVHFVQSQKLLTQLDVPVHRREVLVYDADQIVVYGTRNVVAGEGGFPG